VTIVPDELTNSLLVRASAADFAIIESAVQQLDLRPLQVLIQVLIVEARKDRLFALGVDATASGTFDQGKGEYTGTLVGGGLGTFVLQVMHMASLDLDVVLRAAVSRGDAKIVSRPVLLASNNREARILVGSQRPFVQVSRSLPTDTPTRDQVVQYKDVGTKLTVLPTINPDGYVNLLIRQEMNSATAEVQFDAPVIATRETETDVLVRDGQTVVLGGLREQLHEMVKSGIPLLSDLPIIGGLFGVQERRTTETELFLFITPLVLRDDAVADSAAAAALKRAAQTGGKLEERQP
jgi:general secretion pathway protein D